MYRPCQAKSLLSAKPQNVRESDPGQDCCASKTPNSWLFWRREKRPGFSGPLTGQLGPTQRKNSVKNMKSPPNSQRRPRRTAFLLLLHLVDELHQLSEIRGLRSTLFRFLYVTSYCQEIYVKRIIPSTRSRSAGFGGIGWRGPV